MNPPTQIVLEGCAIDLHGQTVIRGDTTTRLTNQEATVLRYLVARPGQLVSRSELLTEVWGAAATMQTRAVDVCISRLRKKIEANPSKPKHLLVVRGEGYRFYPLQAAQPLDPAKRAQCTNLPVAHTTFFGRENALTTMQQHLAQGARPLTIVGTGGLGKTRLAQEFGNQRLAAYPGGVWFCDLRAATDLASILRIMAQSLGLILTKGDPVTQIGHGIEQRSVTLIIIDNMEQVAQHASATVGEWVKTANQAHFIVTSRAWLDLETEQMLSLGPLSTKNGEALFVDRAKRAWPAFALDKSTEKRIEQIVEQVDGLALAIELAAARVAVLSPQTLHDRLTERFKVLRDPTRSSSATHSTLWGVIAESWALLNPWAQSALAQCAVFRGGFTLESAEAVLDLSAWAEAPPAMDVLHRLHTQSLLQISEPFEGARRFDLLQSIHDFAAEHIEHTVALSLRHARYFALLGQTEHLASLDVEGGASRRRSLECELDNLLMAVDTFDPNHSDMAADCALAAFEVIRMRGPIPTGSALIKRVADFSGLSAESQIRLLRVTAWLQNTTGNRVEARASLEQGLALSRSCQNQHLEGVMRSSLGIVERTLGALEEAEEHYRCALRIHRQTNDKRSVGIVLMNLGNLLQTTARTEEAEACFKESLGVLQQTGNLRAQGVVLSRALGPLQLSQGRLDDAIASFEAALLLLREIGDTRSEGMALNNLGIAHQKQGDHQAAVTHLQNAISLLDVVADRGASSMAKGALGETYWVMGAVEQAEKWLTEALGCEVIEAKAALPFEHTLKKLRESRRSGEHTQTSARARTLKS